MSFHAFRCAECGTRVEQRLGPGRTESWRRSDLVEVVVRLPPDVPQTVCPKCGEVFHSPKDGEIIERLAWKQYPPSPLSIDRENRIR